MSYFCFYKKGNILSIEKKERENVGYLEEMKPAVKSKVNRVQRGFYMSITATAESSSSIFISKIALEPTQRKRSPKYVRGKKKEYDVTFNGFAFCKMKIKTFLC